jgi:hypothetical protein
MILRGYKQTVSSLPNDKVALNRAILNLISQGTRFQDRLIKRTEILLMQKKTDLDFSSSLFFV